VTRNRRAGPAGARDSHPQGPDLSSAVPEPPTPPHRRAATQPTGPAAETSAPRAAKVPAGKLRRREWPTAAVGPDARELAPEVATPPIRDDLTRERPTVAISVDVEYWAHLERMARIPYEGRTQFLAAVRDLVWTVAALILMMLGLLLVGFHQTSVLDVQEILGGAGVLVGATGGVGLARRRQRPSTTRRR
jgi:hypothetical protein